MSPTPSYLTVKLRWQNGRWHLITVDGVEYRALSEIPDPQVRRQIQQLMAKSLPVSPVIKSIWPPLIVLGIGIILLLFAGLLGYQAGLQVVLGTGLPGIGLASIGGLWFLKRQRAASVQEIVSPISTGNEPHKSLITKPEVQEGPPADTSQHWEELDAFYEAVIASDRQTLTQLNLSHHQLADKLDSILHAVWRQQTATIAHTEESRRRSNIPEVIQSAKHVIALDNLPDPNCGYRVDEQFQVFIALFRGNIHKCPWGCTNVNGSSNFWLLNRQSGELIFAPSLLPHEIGKHEFFGELGGSYRVDPIRLAKVLFPDHLTVWPTPEIPPQFPRRPHIRH